MKHIEVLKQALEALEFEANGWEDPPPITREAITALRERLAQPQMQPCAGRNCGSTNPNLHSAECFEDYEKATGMNQWVGLTDEAIWLEYQRFWPFHPADEPRLAQDIAKFARAIEAKLKEKNT